MAISTRIHVQKLTIYQLTKTQSLTKKLYKKGLGFGSKKKNAKAQSAQPSEKRVRTITDTDDEEFNRVHAQYQETAERD